MFRIFPRIKVAQALQRFLGDQDPGGSGILAGAEGESDQRSILLRTLEKIKGTQVTRNLGLLQLRVAGEVPNELPRTC